MPGGAGSKDRREKVDMVGSSFVYMGRVSSIRVLTLSVYDQVSPRSPARSFHTKVSDAKECENMRFVCLCGLALS